MTEGAIEHEGANARPDEPPTMLHHAFDAAPHLDPVRTTDTVTSMHQTWARVATGDAERSASRGKVGRLLEGLSAQAVRDDRTMLGELIRATDALAARCDELADRVMALEGALAEMVDVFGADLTRLRAATLAGALEDEAHPPHG